MDVDPVALAAADPLPVLLAWLRGNAIIEEEFGGPEHVSGTDRAPYPHLVLTTTTGGRASDMVYTNTPEVMLEVYAAPDGTPGKAELWRLMVIAASVLAAYPDNAPPHPSAVISAVRPSSPFLYASDPRSPTPGTGAGRFYCTFSVPTHAVYSRA